MLIQEEEARERRLKSEQEVAKWEKELSKRLRKQRKQDLLKLEEEKRKKEEEERKH